MWNKNTKTILYKIIYKIGIMVGFGILSIIFGTIQFKIPGLTDSLSDLREVAIIISIVFIPNWILIIGISFITSLSVFIEGYSTSVFISTFIMHAIAGTFAWYAYLATKNKINTIIKSITIWLLIVLFYYIVFLMPSLYISYYIFNLTEELSFSTFFNILASTKYEILTTTLVVSLFMTLKMAKETLNEKLDWLNFIIEGANLGFWKWDINKQELIYNKKWLKQMHFDVKEKMSQEILFSKFHKDDIEQINQKIVEGFKNKNNNFITLEHRFYDGKNNLHWFLTNAKITRRNNLGKAERSIGFHIDITDYKKSLEEKLLTEKKYREIFNATKDIIIVQDFSNYKIININNALKSILGFDKEEIINYNISVLSAKNSLFNADSLIDKLNYEKNNLQKSFEWQLQKKDKSVIWVDISLMVSKISGENILLTVIRDKHQDKLNRLELETYRTHLENAVEMKTGEVHSLNVKLQASNDKLHTNNEVLIQQKEKLEKTLEELKNTQLQLIQSEKMASIGTLVSGVAHEINNPLNFISSGLEILKQIEKEISDHLSTESLETFLFSTKTVKEGLDRTSKIVKSLMSFSNIVISKKEILNLTNFIEKNILFFNSQIEKDIILQVDFKVKEEISIYPDKLHQAILNIIDNSIFELKDITIKEKILKIKTFYKKQKDTNYAVISIFNSGKKISPDVLNKIFDPFFTTKNPNEGVGLGLSICYAIIKEHNGFIEVENLEKGVETRLYLPITVV